MPKAKKADDVDELLRQIDRGEVAPQAFGGLGRGAITPQITPAPAPAAPAEAVPDITKMSPDELDAYLKKITGGMGVK